MNEGDPEHDQHARRSARPPQWPEFPGYRVLGVLGRGGMGTIFRAVQVGMERPVAIKVLRSDLARQGLSVERLQREARVAGRLDHPQIVKGIEVGEHAGRHFFVMEYVDGRSLKAVLKSRGALEEDEVLEIGIQIARALAHAHTHGIIHRDVKPGNILIGPGGSIKLTDLGLARGPEDPTLTMEGATVGTPQYMAPEQARDSGQVDRRSDIYSLGATLFHALTGRPPFESETIAQLLTKVLHDPAPDPARVRPEVSDGLALVVRKALQKDPSRRYPSAAAMLADLQRVRDHLPPRVTASTLDELDARFGLRIALCALLLVLVVIGGLVFFGDEQEGGMRSAVQEEDPFLRDVRSAREGVETALAEEHEDSAAGSVLLGPYLRVLEMLAHIDALSNAPREGLREQLDQDRVRLEAALLRQLTNLAHEAERRAEVPTEREAVGVWRSALRSSMGVDAARLPPTLRDAARELEARVLATWDKQRRAALEEQRAALLGGFEQFVKRDLDLGAELREGYFAQALERLERQYEAARLPLKELLDDAAYRAARTELDAVADPFRHQVETTSQARIKAALDALDDIDARLRAERFDFDRLGERSAREWLDGILEEHGLSADGDLPLAMRLERDPYLLRDGLVVRIEHAAKARQEERADRAWAIARANLDVYLSQRRFLYARAYLAEKARGEIAAGPAALDALEDRRTHLVDPLAELQEAIARYLQEASGAQRNVRASLRDGRELRGVPRLLTGAAVELAGAAVDLENIGFDLGREKGLRIEGFSAATLLAWGGAQDGSILGPLLQFADHLSDPTNRALEDALQPLKDRDRTRWLALVDWREEAIATWRKRSEQVREQIDATLVEVIRAEDRGEVLEALEQLQALSERFANAPELLTSGLDEIHRRLERRLAVARIEKEVRAKVSHARVSLAADESTGTQRTRVSYDLLDPSVAADLGLSKLDGWVANSTQGLRRAESATTWSDVENAASLVFDWGPLEFDLDFPVRIELEIRCLADSGRPFFGSVTQSEWTLGLLGQGYLPLRAAEKETNLLADEAGISWPRGEIFWARGRSIAATSALLAKSQSESASVWSAPWNGFLRASTQHLILVWTERATRVQVFLGESTTPLLEARPSRVRGRHLRQLTLRSWEPLAFQAVTLEGKLQ